MSLDDRVAKIQLYTESTEVQQRYQLDGVLKVSRPTLTKWYKQNNFNYVRPNHKISSRYADAAMLELQQEFCAKLIEYWRED